MRGAWLLVCAGCSSASSAAPATRQAADSGALDTEATCTGARTLACRFFDAASGSWSETPPASLSLAQACAPGGDHGEIDAYVATPGQYWLDRVGFVATGTAVRITTLRASDDAGGATYGCGQGGGPVLTQLLCGNDVGTGTLALRFSFAGHWADGAAWSQDCDATVEVAP